MFATAAGPRRLSRAVAAKDGIGFRPLSGGALAMQCRCMRSTILQLMGALYPVHNYGMAIDQSSASSNVQPDLQLWLAQHERPYSVSDRPARRRRPCWARCARHAAQASAQEPLEQAARRSHRCLCKSAWTTSLRYALIPPPQACKRSGDHRRGVGSSQAIAPCSSAVEQASSKGRRGEAGGGLPRPCRPPTGDATCRQPVSRGLIQVVQSAAPAPCEACHLQRADPHNILQ